MKKLLIFLVAIIALQTVSAQGPLYNFNFYNEGSDIPAANVNQAQPVAETVVKEIVKEHKEKGESLFGFEVGFGKNRYGSYDSIDVIGFNLLFRISNNIKAKIGIISQNKYINSATQEKGLSVGLCLSTTIIGALAIATELEAQRSKRSYDSDDDELYRSYVGVSLGPQLHFGRFQLNLLGKIGYNKLKDSFGNSYHDGLGLGAQANFGFMI